DDFARCVINDFVPFAFHPAVLVGQLERGLDLVIVAGACQALGEVAASRLVVDLAGYRLDLAVLERDGSLAGPVAVQFLEGIAGLCRRMRQEKGQGGNERKDCALGESTRHYLPSLVLTSFRKPHPWPVAGLSLSLPPHPVGLRFGHLAAGDER